MRQLLNILASMADLYPASKLTPNALRLYAELLGDLEIEDVRAAVRVLVTQSKYFPTVAEIRSQALSARPDAPPNFEDAWGEVLLNASKVGARGVPEFSHQAVRDAVKACGGWREICLTDTDKGKRAFASVYSSRAQAALLAPKPKQLTAGDETR